MFCISVNYNTVSKGIFNNKGCSFFTIFHIIDLFKYFKGIFFNWFFFSPFNCSSNGRFKSVKYTFNIGHITL